MTFAESENIISILLNIKKRPKMYIRKPCMSYLSALHLGFFLGCCNNEKKLSIEKTDSIFDEFIDELCKKYSINSPWYNELIDYCNSDEKAYELFMEELESYLKVNHIDISKTN